MAVDDADEDGPKLVTVSGQADGFANVSDTVTVLDDEGVSSDSLVAHWTFDEGTGRTAGDSSPYGQDNYGLLIPDATWATGVFDGAVQLDGLGGYVSVSDSADLNLNTHAKRTIGLWFNADDVAVSTQKQVLYEEGGTTRGLSIYLHDGSLYVGGWNKSESNWGGTFLSTGQITSGQWHHVALVLDAGATVENDVFAAYLDGQEFSRGAGSQLWSRSDDIGIGRVAGATVFHTGDSGSNGDGFAGKIDEARVYNRALTSEEIAMLADSGVDPELALTITADSISENGGVTTATLSRNTPTDVALIVTLTQR